MDSVDITSLKHKVYQYRWTIFFVLLFSYFFVYFHRMTVGILGTDIVTDVGGTVGILSAAYFWTYTAMQIPSGLLADHLGPRRATSIFMTIAAIGSMMTAFGTEFWIIVLGKILIAAGMAVIYVPLMKIVSVWFKKTDFPQLNGIVIAVGNVGAIAASAPLEMLSEAVGGWRAVFTILGVVTLALAFLCFALVRDHPHKKSLPGIDEIELAENGTLISDNTASKMPIFLGMKAVMAGGRKFWPMAIAYFLIYGSIMVFQGTWAKTYFNNVYDFALSVAWFITMIGIGKILSTVVVGILSGRGIISSKRRIMIFGTFCYAAIWFVLWFLAGEIDSYWFWFGVSFLFGFFGGFMTLSFTQVKEWYPIAISGTSVSLMNVFLFLGSSVGTTVAGIVIGTTYSLSNFSAVWGMMFVTAIVAFAMVCISKERPRSEAE